MEKFNRTLRGYDPEEVNNFLDKVINQVEQMVDEIKDKDKRIKELESLEKENEGYKTWISAHKSNYYTIDFYHGNIVETAFNEWIEKGMPL